MRKLPICGIAFLADEPATDACLMVLVCVLSKDTSHRAGRTCWQLQHVNQHSSISVCMITCREDLNACPHTIDQCQ